MELVELKCTDREAPNPSSCSDAMKLVGIER